MTHDSVRKTLLSAIGKIGAKVVGLLVGLLSEMAVRNNPQVHVFLHTFSWSHL